MRKYVLPWTLFILEISSFYLLANFLDLPRNVICHFMIVFVLFLFVFEHYKISSKLIWDEIKSVGKAMICFFIVEVVILSAFNGDDWFLSIVILTAAMYFIILFLDRTLRILLRENLARRTLIIGVGYEAARLGNIAQNNRFALTKVIGYLRYKNEPIDEELVERYEKKINTKQEINIYEDMRLEEIIKKEKIDQVIVALPGVPKKEINKLMLRLYDKVKVIKYIPEVNGLLTFNSKIQDFDGTILISTAQGSIGFVDKVIKRLIDIIAAIFGILLLVPIAIYVRCKNHKNGDYNSIFFSQERIGLDGKPIKIYKFRTMIPNAEQVLEELMEKDVSIKEEYLKNKKLQNDPRITEAGHFLRKSSLDEFPQFINVLKGEMSLVGPRPYLFREKDDMGVYYNSVIQCKPGITGMWQANGRSDVGFEDRCKLDDYYYRNWNLSLDMIILYKTVKSVFYGKGAL